MDGISAIWLCGKDQLAAVRAAVRLNGDGSEHLVLLALDQEAFGRCSEFVGAHPRVAAYPACDGEAFAVSLCLAITSSSARYIQFRLNDFQYQQIPLDLLADRVIGLEPEAASFEYGVTWRSCNWVKGGALVRRSYPSHPHLLSDPEGAWFKRTFLLDNLARLIRMPPKRASLAIWLEHLLGQCKARYSSRLIIGRLMAGTGEAEVPWNGYAFVDHELSWMMEGLTATEHATECSPLQRLIRTVRLANFATLLSPAAREWAELRLGDVFEDTFEEFELQAGKDPGLRHALNVLLADVLNVSVFSTLDHRLAAASEQATCRIREELCAGAENPFLNTLVTRTLDGRLDGPEHEKDTSNGAPQRDPALRWECLKWRMEYARTAHQLKLARIHNRKLVGTNRSLNDRITVYETATKQADPTSNNKNKGKK